MAQLDKRPGHEEMRRLLTKARRRNDRASRAPAGSNERRKMLTLRDSLIKQALGVAAAYGIPSEDVPRWAREEDITLASDGPL